MSRMRVSMLAIGTFGKLKVIQVARTRRIYLSKQIYVLDIKVCCHDIIGWKAELSVDKKSVRCRCRRCAPFDV